MLPDDGVTAAVHRSGLLARMTADVAAGAKVIVLSAPAGAGKTITLHQWAQSRSAAGDVVATVTAGGVDTIHDLPSVLLTSIRAAARDTEQRPTIPQPRQARQSIQGRLGDVLLHAAGELDRPLWLIIDDAHTLTNTPAAGELGTLISSTHSQLRVALAARYTPHNSLPKLIVEGTASEFRAADLAFSRDEARALLAAEDVSLDDADLDILLDRTEGWAAGLRLAAMALTRTDDRSSFVATFAGDDHAVADYLVAEVLSAMPHDVVELLLAVCVADAVDVDLARVLSQRHDAGAILNHLEATNTLVHRSPHHPHWYQLHPLLHTYLRAEARRRDAAQYAKGHAQASQWFERNGELRTAIRHSAGAEDWDRVEHLVTSYGARLLMTDGPDAMRTTLAMLPPPVQLRPTVAAMGALTAVADGNLPAARLDLAALGAPDEVPQARRALLDSMITLREPGDEPLTRTEIDHANSDVAAATDHDPDLLPMAQLAHVSALVRLGDLDAAEAEVSSVARVARRREHDHLLVESLNGLSSIALLKGDLNAAYQAASDSLDACTSRSWDQKPWLSPALTTLAFVDWQRGHDAEAAAHASSAAATADADAQPGAAALAGCLADVTAIRPGAKLSLLALARLHDLTDIWPLLPPQGVAFSCGFQLLVATGTGEFDWAGDVAARAAARLGNVADVAIFRAMVHAHQGRDMAARSELEPVLASGVSDCLCPMSTVMAHAVAAHLADRAGEPAKAHDALISAIDVARPRMMLRAMLGAAPAVNRVLIRDRGRFGTLEPFADELLAFASVHYPADSRGANPSATLTERELAVLHDLPSLMSLREIADAHVVSVNTVKTHLKAVYRKLGASSRREAVNHARELGIL